MNTAINDLLRCCRKGFGGNMKRTLAMMLILCALMGKVPQVLRLHVLAHSNDARDQRVKLEVRDAINDYLRDEMEDIGAFDDAKAYIQARLDIVKALADGVLDRYGLPYRSSVSVGIAAFPERIYGGVVFPQGDYHALKVSLGEGEGENWWCVLFPPLCLLEVETVDEQWKPEDGVTYKSWFAALFQ
jgi:stage II sporulation protein R